MVQFFSSGSLFHTEGDGTKEMLEGTCEKKELMGGGGWQGVSESHCQGCDPEAERSEVKVTRMKDEDKPEWCL